MFTFKKVINKKKGFILIHTYLICLLMLLMVLYIYSLQINEYAYNESIKKEVSKSDDYLRYREVLLTKLNSYVKQNIEVKTSYDIKSYFDNLHDKNIALYGKGKVIYNSNNYFELVTPYRIFYWRHDLYDYTVRKGRMILIFKGTMYSETA